MDDNNFLVMCGRTVKRRRGVERGERTYGAFKLVEAEAIHEGVTKD